MGSTDGARTTGKLSTWLRGLAAQADAQAAAPTEAEAPPAPPETEPQPAPEDDGAARSDKRLRFLMAFIKDPTSSDAFLDRARVFSVATEERSYQQHRIVALDAEIKRLPPPAAAMGLSPEEAAAHPTYAELEPRRERLATALATARKRQFQVFNILKHISGVQGRSGGTDYLARARGDTPPPTDEFLDRALAGTLRPDDAPKPGEMLDTLLSDLFQPPTR